MMLRDTNGVASSGGQNDKGSLSSPLLFWPSARRHKRRVTAAVAILKYRVNDRILYGKNVSKIARLCARVHTHLEDTKWRTEEWRRYER